MKSLKKFGAGINKVKKTLRDINQRNKPGKIKQKDPNAMRHLKRGPGSPAGPKLKKRK